MMWIILGPIGCRIFCPLWNSAFLSRFYLLVRTFPGWTRIWDKPWEGETSCTNRNAQETIQSLKLLVINLWLKCARLRRTILLDWIPEILRYSGRLLNTWIKLPVQYLLYPTMLLRLAAIKIKKPTYSTPSSPPVSTLLTLSCPLLIQTLLGLMSALKNFCMPLKRWNISFQLWTNPKLLDQMEFHHNTEVHCHQHCPTRLFNLSIQSGKVPTEWK